VRYAPTVQTIIYDYPPNFAEISLRFGLGRKPSVVFCFGDRIYSPQPGPIHPAVLAHEGVHGQRQGSSQLAVMEWWRRYLDDTAFRLAEEIPAHVAEYRYWLDHGSRAERRRALQVTADRLAAPLYGRMIGRSAARDMIRAGAKALQEANQ